MVINNSYSSKGLWVDATPSGYSNWSNSTLKNAFTGTTTSVYSDGRVWVEAPARSYAVYVQSGDYIQYSLTKSTKTIVKNCLNPLKAVKLNAYPNPITNSTKITFSTMQRGQVSVKIYDHTGRNIETVYDAVRESGNHEFMWVPKGIASGIYFAKIQGDGQTQTLKLIFKK